MATYEELREAITEYMGQASANERVRRSLRHWNCLIYIEAEDLGQGFTMQIHDSKVTVRDGPAEQPDPRCSP